MLVDRCAVFEDFVTKWLHDVNIVVGINAERTKVLFVFPDGVGKPLVPRSLVPAIPASQGIDYQSLGESI